MILFSLLILINQEGTTPLILASANNNLDCVKELLEQGADPNARRLVSASKSPKMIPSAFQSLQNGYQSLPVGA